MKMGEIEGAGREHESQSRKKVANVMKAAVGKNL